MSLREPGENPENVALESESASSFGMNFIHAPLDSLDDVTDGENDLIDRVLVAMNDPDLQPVFIHCEHGRDRTGLLVALYRVRYQHWSIKDAHREWVALGHTVFSQVFTGDLDEYFYKKAKQIGDSR